MIALKIIGIVAASILGLIILALAGVGLVFLLSGFAKAKHEAELYLNDK